MIKPKQGDIIKMTWLDAFGKGAWGNWNDIEEGLKNPILCEIVGYYATEDKNHYVISMGIQTDEKSDPFLKLEFIPKGSVVDIKKIG